MKKIKDLFEKYIITGLPVLLPIWATYYVPAASLGVIDGVSGGVPACFSGLKFPGLGVITLILPVVGAGLRQPAPAGVAHPLNPGIGGVVQ